MVGGITRRAEVWATRGEVGRPHALRVLFLFSRRKNERVCDGSHSAEGLGWLRACLQRHFGVTVFVNGTLAVVGFAV